MATNQALVEAIYRNMTGGGGGGPGTNFLGGQWGFRINRPAVPDVAGVFTPVFTIAGGFAVVTTLFGIRTVAQGGGAGTISFQHNGIPTVLDSGVTAITGDAPDTIYGSPLDPTGVAGVAVIAYVGIPIAIFVLPAQLFFGPGTIEVLQSVTTGSTAYYMTYWPVDENVTVTVA
jgi:hypothetical protein